MPESNYHTHTCPTCGKGQIIVGTSTPKGDIAQATCKCFQAVGRNRVLEALRLTGADVPPSLFEKKAKRK